MNTIDKMKNIWNQLKYWQRGSFIGFLIGSIPLIYSLLPSRLQTWPVLFFPNLYVSTYSFDLHLWIFLMIGFISGTIFGFILDKISKRVLFQKLSNAKKFLLVSLAVLIINLSLFNLFLVASFAFAFIFMVTTSEYLALSLKFILFPNLFLIPFILMTTFLFTLLGWILDHLEKDKTLNLFTSFIYLFFWLCFLLIVYSIFIEIISFLIGILIPS